MWARLHPRPYVYGVRGHSCQACVWRMGVLAELASARGLSVFALLLDIQKAFEQVRHKLLIRRASEFGFHPALLR
eukprot:7874732-Pyramimonas_sp.AAC.1